MKIFAVGKGFLMKIFLMLCKRGVRGASWRVGVDSRYATDIIGRSSVKGSLKIFSGNVG